MGKVVVLGASPDQERYSFRAVKALKRRQYDVVAVGNQPGDIMGVEIMTDEPPVENVDTLVLYINAYNQKKSYDYIFSLKPRRIIFNPGTQNDELQDMARKKGIEVIENCALIMLGNGIF